MNKYFSVVLLLVACVLVLYVISSYGVSDGFNQLKVQDITDNYFKTHTYSQSDLFSCVDYSIDLWNQFRTAGFNAKLAIGNLEKNNATVEDINHAWVLVEISPFNYVAVETTRGMIFTKDQAPEYFSNTLQFHTPGALKKYLELRQNYFDELNKLNYGQSTSICQIYQLKIKQYNDAVESYNQGTSERRVGVSSDKTIFNVGDFTDLNTLKQEISKLQIQCEDQDAGFASQLSDLQDTVEKMDLLLL